MEYKQGTIHCFYRDSIVKLMGKTFQINFTFDIVGRGGQDGEVNAVLAFPDDHITITTKL